MDTILELIKDYRAIVGAILVVFSTAAVIAKWWDEVSLWWLNVLYSLPLIGKTTRLARQTDSVRQDGWFNSERTLCTDYHRHYKKADKNGNGYDRCRVYLNKVQETGRDNLHILGWFLIAVMVFLEALGFSYVLSGYTIPGASENLQQKGAIGIAFLISVLLVALTHFTGHELHKNSLVKKTRAWFNQDHRNEKPSLIPDTRVSLENNVDDDSPQYIQLLNRLDTNATVTPKYYISMVTALFIAIVAIGATYVRGQVLEKEMAEQTAGFGESYDSSPYASDPYAEEESLPAELSATQQEADNKVKQEIRGAEKKGGWGTFIVLAVIFIFLQIFGVILGYKTGFVGKESKTARKYIGRFATKEDFLNFYELKKQQVVRTAEKKLTNLQHRMVDNGLSQGVDPKITKRLKEHADRTFTVFLHGLESKLKHAESNNRQSVSEDITDIGNELDNDSGNTQHAEFSRSEETEEQMRERLEKEFLAKRQVEMSRERETKEQREARILDEIKAKYND